MSKRREGEYQMASCKAIREKSVNFKSDLFIHNRLQFYAEYKDSSMTVEFEKWVKRLKLPPEFEEKLRQSLIEK